MSDLPLIDAHGELGDEYDRLLKEMRAIIAFVEARSRDGMIEMHERQQWRRLLVICRRAIGEG